jgi:hypothetical protein
MHLLFEEIDARAGSNRGQLDERHEVFDRVHYYVRLQSYDPRATPGSMRPAHTDDRSVSTRDV